MPTLLAGLLRSLAFLSRFPAPAAAFRGAPALARDAWAFPLAGLAIGALPALLLLGSAALGLSPPASVLLALALLAFITGALHEDGLADTADGLFGHADRERALLIMADSRIGAYGALALILSVSIRAALLVELGARAPASAALALLGAASSSRGAMGWLWSSLPAAKPSGLAAGFGRPAPRVGLAALAIGALLTGGCGLAAVGWLAAVLPPALAFAAVLVLRGRFRRRLGGQTGDTLGAAQQIADAAALLGFALAAA